MTSTSSARSGASNRETQPNRGPKQAPGPAPRPGKFGNGNGALSRGTRRLPALVRRIWIVPVSIIVVAAIAYAVAGLQSSTYTAQSTVVVTSAPGPLGQTSPAASNLAATYAGALPNDPTLQAYIGKTAHVNPLGAITAPAPRGSVITLDFFASTKAGALAGARAIGSGLSGARPASSVVSPNTLSVLQDPFIATINPASVSARAAKIQARAAALASGIRTPQTPLPPSQTDRFMAQVVLIVPASGAGPSEGINPDDANHLATTYAGIIPVDDTLLADIGKAVGQSSSQVASNLSVVNEQNTSLLQISYKASTPQAATNGARAAAGLLAGPTPVAAGIVPSSLGIVSLPPPATNVAATPARKGGTVAIGAALGLILGLILLIAWERSDPHVVDAKSLSGQFGCPATPVDRLSPDAAHALTERWASLTDHVPARVALLPADAAAVEPTNEIANLLRHSGQGVGYIDARSGTVPGALSNGHLLEGKESVVLVHAGPPGKGGEAIALSCDLTVVAVRTGARNTEIRRLAEDLANFGLVPAWALLSPRRGHVGTQQQPHADALPA
jgi:capsular polysaccharide biosynthesis protein